MPQRTANLVAGLLIVVAMLHSDVLPAQVFQPPPFEAVPYAQPNQAQQTTPIAPENSADAPKESGELYEAGEVLAAVGDQFIIAADVLPHVNQIIASNADRIPPDVLQEQRRVLTAQLTRSHVETKLLYLAFLRKVPADKVKEIRTRVAGSFDEELDEERRKCEKMEKADQEEMIRRTPQIGRLVLLMKERGAWSQRELDAILREFSGSLAQERQFYIEHKLGRAVVSQNIKFQPEITYNEMLQYYKDNEKKFSYPNRAKFEAIMVRVEEFPSRDDAYNAIAAMGNEIYFGANFAAVAKRSSQGLNAKQGGLHDWTPRGSLVSKPLEEAVFSLEPAKLSSIIEDEKAFYILRVIERQAAGVVPFPQVQDEIKENIRKEKIQKQYESFVQSTRNSILVTTAFDDDPKLRMVVRPDESKQR